jgi:tetratricopeptide (TPR) repeat protein
MRMRATIAVCFGLLLLATCACSRDVERAKREHVERGDRYMAEKNTDAAIIEYRNAVQQDPRFAEAYRKLSAAYIARGDGPEAIRAAVAAADLLSGDVDAQIEAGSLLLLSGQFVKAKERAEKVLTADAKNVRARVLLGNATAGLKDIDTAIKEFEEALRLDPQQSGIYTGLATLKATAGDRESAERIFKQAIEADPQSALAKLALAQFYWSGERLEDAERLMKEAHTLQSHDPQVNLTLALFYQATHRPAEAEPFLREAASGSDDRRVTLMLADYYMAHNRRPDATKLLEPLAADKRWGVMANIRLAALAQLDGRPADALAIIDRAVAIEPNNSSALAAKSELLRQQNNLDEAVKVADAAVAANSQSAEAQLVRGRVLRAKGSVEKAEEAFNEALRLNPRAGAARVELAQLRIGSRANDAVAVAEEAAKANPENLDARMTLARALTQKREFDKAQVILDELVRTAPRMPAVHAQMGALLTVKRDLPGARAAFNRALELDPVRLEALAGLTALDMAAGQRDAALARVDAALARAPKNTGLLVLAANAHASSRNFSRAEQLAIAAVEADPNALAAYSLLGRVYLAEKKLDAARGQFEKIAARQDRPVAALTVIGTIDMLQNRNAEAQQTFERVLKLDPKAGVAANNLSWLYLEYGGSVDLALHLAEVAKTALPDSPEVNDTLGWAHYKKGSMLDAISALRRSLELDPKSATTIYHLALAYEKSGDVREARAIMTRYLQIDPTSERSADVRRRLQALGT